MLAPEVLYVLIYKIWQLFNVLFCKVFKSVYSNGKGIYIYLNISADFLVHIMGITMFVYMCGPHFWQIYGNCDSGPNCTNSMHYYCPILVPAPSIPLFFLYCFISLHITPMLAELLHNCKMICVTNKSIHSSLFRVKQN